MKWLLALALISSSAFASNPLEAKCAAGFESLAKWKSKFARKVQDAGDKAACTHEADAAEEQAPVPPIQCQHLKYGETSSKFKSFMSSFADDTPKAKDSKMSEVFGNARTEVLRNLFGKCDAAADADFAHRSGGGSDPSGVQANTQRTPLKRPVAPSKKPVSSGSHSTAHSGQ